MGNIVSDLVELILNDIEAYLKDGIITSGEVASGDANKDYYSGSRDAYIRVLAYIKSMRQDINN